MVNLYKFVLDELNSNVSVYGDDILLGIVPYGSYTVSPFLIDSSFSVLSVSGTMFEILVVGGASAVKNLKFDLSGIFTQIEATTYFDVSIWDSSTYTTELFYVSKGVNGVYGSLNEINMAFDQITSVGTGLTYVAFVEPIFSIVTRASKGLPLTHSEMDNNFIGLKLQSDAQQIEINNQQVQIDSVQSFSNPFGLTKHITPRFSLSRPSATQNKIKLFSFDLPSSVGLTADKYFHISFHGSEFVVYDTGRSYTVESLGYSVNLKFTFSTGLFTVSSENFVVGEDNDNYKIDLINNRVVVYYNMSYDDLGTTTQFAFTFFNNYLNPTVYDTFEFVEIV